MVGVSKGMRLGAGLLGLGYGVYRLSQGRKDWVTSTALTAGLTATLTGMKAKRHHGMVPQIRSMASNVPDKAPRFQRTLFHMAPTMMTKARSMLDALR